MTEARSLSVGLLDLMIREEYRLHSRLFGDRFAAFPVLVLALSGGGFWLLGLTDTSTSAIAAGVHGLVFFFGLQVGTIGLVGRDALRDVLGDVTPLVFASRTLPVTWRRLLGVFLLKDLLFYSVLFVGPVALGYAGLALSEGVAVESVALLWLTAAGAFGLGIGTSLTLAGLGTRSRWLVALAALPVAVAIATGRLDPVTVSPLAFYEDPTARTALTGFGPAAALLLAGPLAFQPAEDRVARSAPERYTRLRGLLRDRDGVATRTTLELARSSGSVWKVLFSMGVLVGVTVLVVQEVGRATALSPSPGIALGTFLGLGAFTTYNWVTLYDDAGEYLRYPLSMRTVFAGKRTACLLATIPAGVAYLALSAVWISPAEVGIALVVFPLVTIYVVGVTAYVAGLSPNELLFDTPLFLAYGASLAALSLPLVVAALARDSAPTAATGGAVAVAAVGAVIGTVLSRRAGPRWDRKVR